MTSAILPTSSSCYAPSGSVTGSAAAFSNAFSGIFSMLQNHAQSGLQSRQEISLENGTKAQLLLLPSDQTTLRNFLAGIENGQQNLSSSDLSNGLTDHILIALTSGTPALPNSNGLANNSVTTLSLEEFSDLVSTHSDVLNNANVLLIAAPVQPSDMESLAKNITEILSKADGSSSDKDLPPHPVSSDSNDLNAVSIAGLHVILVTFFDPKSNAQHPDFISIPDSLLYAGVIAPPLVPSAKSGSAPTATAENTSPFAPSGDDPYTPLKPFEAVQNNEALANHQSAKKASSSTTTGQDKFSGLLDTSKPEQSASFRFLSGATSSASTLGLDGSLPNPAATVALQGQSALTNPVLTHASAAASHPAVQTLSATLTNNFQNGAVKSQQLDIELDPPELGRVQVQLSLEKGSNLKVLVLAENKETLELLKRDIHSLRHALDSAGIKTDDSSLSFDMSNNSHAFQQTLENQNGRNGLSQGKSGNTFKIGVDGTDLSGLASESTIDTSLGIHIDEATGAIRYNIMA